jgi:hypothetical protein
MLFLEPAPGETRIPVLRIWDVAQLLRGFAEPSTGGFSGITALRKLLECREAFERAWRLEVMKREHAPEGAEGVESKAGATPDRLAGRRTEGWRAVVAGTPRAVVGKAVAVTRKAVARRRDPR